METASAAGSQAAPITADPVCLVPTSSSDAIVVAQQLSESPSAPLAVEAAVIQTFMSEGLHLQQVASSTLVASRCLKNVPETISALQDQVKVVKVVRNWAKATIAGLEEEKQAPYKDVLVFLNRQEEQNTRMVVAGSEVAQHCGDLMRTMEAILRKVRMNFAVPGVGGPNFERAVLDTWNSAIVEPELRQVELLAKEIAGCYEQLALNTPESIYVPIQALEGEMFASNIVQEACNQLKETRDRKQLREKRYKERALDEGKLHVLKSWVADGKAKIEVHTTFIDSLKSRHTSLTAKKKELQMSRTTTKDQAVQALRNLKEHAQQQVAELAKQQDASLAQRHAKLQEVSAGYEAKVRELEAELFTLSSGAANHFIICIDHSGSMSGLRWNSALTALESFRSARLEQGSQDLVSIVPFNHNAYKLMTGQPISSDFVGLLRTEVVPSGGTSYRPAWEEVAKCSREVMPGSRLCVVFITDGMASDIPAAQQVAEKLHKDRSDTVCFVVNIDSAVKDDVLAPLVKAGNGDRDVIDTCGELTPLLVNVAAVDMVAKFQRLANLVNRQVSSLKSRIGLVHAREQQDSHQQLAAAQQAGLQADLRLKNLEESCSRAEKATEDDLRQIQGMLQGQLKEVDNEIDELNRSIDHAETRLNTLLASVAGFEREVAGHQKYLDTTKAETDKDLENLAHLHTEAADSLQKVVNMQRSMQSQAGTTHYETVRQRLEDLDNLKRLSIGNFFQSSDQSCIIRSLHRFLSIMCDQIRNPLAGADVHHASKADFVFPVLLSERGLVAHGSASSNDSLGIFLQHEGHSMMADSDDVKQAVKIILQAGITAEDVCLACTVQAVTQVDDVKMKVVGKLKSAFYAKNGLGEDCKLRQKLKLFKNKRNDKEEQCEEFKEKHDEALLSGADTAQTDKLEDKLQKAKDEFSASKGKVSEVQEELDDKEKNLEPEIKWSCLLMQLTVDQCNMAYKKQMSRLELQNLVSNLKTYNDKVRVPMLQLIDNVAAAKYAYGIAGGSAACPVQLTASMQGHSSGSSIDAPVPQALM
mmetsp:Transcript_11198/g.39714  ORF Transcript_11198/g.39714 Transcript_11198/m.39714 type:complete len:1042 (-) Transcript_11198:162-3287(-)